MEQRTEDNHLLRIEELENRLAEAEQLIEAIKAGEVDAFAFKGEHHAEIFTLQSGDYAYRMLIENINEGAVNLTEDGLIVYTNSHFSELTSLAYEKVIGTFFTDFVDGGSIEAFNKIFSQALQGSSKGEINLRAGNKIIPVYLSLTSLQPKLATVGIIISDFTEKKKTENVILQYQKVLEGKNQELMRSNAELASFSYIASHDLQEPLRKIQTFLSRILDTEQQSFSDTAKNYFERTMSASARMQSLINALLDYSRTNTTKVDYELTNLNNTVEEVKNTLRETIDEHKIDIQSSVLPTLNAVPLQLYQVFLNIISNAVKYRRTDVHATIGISARTVHRSEIPEGATLTADNYWRVDVVDNGIGFEQEHEKKIYELFQRLHGKSEYEGTGIGLAICKKIIENHGGVIRAIGQPGVGSVFSVYLPLSK